LAFDLHNHINPAPEPLRVAIQNALGHAQTASGKLMAAQGMRTQPTTARDVLEDALTQIELQRMSVERAIDLINGGAS